MSSSILRASLISLVTFVVAVSAIHGLTLKTSTPNVNIGQCRKGSFFNEQQCGPVAYWNLTGPWPTQVAADSTIVEYINSET